MGKKHAIMPAEVGELHRRIEHWRRTRARRSAMPMELWDRAALPARAHGINPVSRALGLSYTSLKLRVIGMGTSALGSSDGMLGFVEVGRVEIGGSAASYSAEVELCHRGGERMRIRITGGSFLDVPQLVRAFWGRGQ